MSVDVETDRNSPAYGELKDAKVIASGVGYDNETIVQFEGGFEPLKASGSVAKARVIRETNGHTSQNGRLMRSWRYRIQLDAVGSDILTRKIRLR